MENVTQSKIELSKHIKLFSLERKTQPHIHHSFSLIRKLSSVEVSSIRDLLHTVNYHSMNT